MYSLLLASSHIHLSVHQYALHHLLPYKSTCGTVTADSQPNVSYRGYFALVLTPANFRLTYVLPNLLIFMPLISFDYCQNCGRFMNGICSSAYKVVYVIQAIHSFSKSSVVELKCVSRDN